ncbi:MAG: DUF58 domain-containing protein [Myxococcales bacterium]|nr:DUF58 domain-containing protein [Myxococcales bacterium]MCB9532728.1 DUF58 domain-containing protein [Myxococcales bacterium]
MLPRELIKKVRRIELVTRRLVDPQLAGAYHSVFKGRGMDFDEVHPYHAGDDVRFIDWNVSARTGDLHVKRFVEERELTVLIVVDVSSSMTFGTGPETKRLVAAQLAAVLAVLAIKNNDRVGLLLVDEQVDCYVPPKKGKKHVLGLVAQILEHRPRAAKTRLSAALEYAVRVSKRRAVVFVISDFLDDGYEHALQIAARRHDVVPVVVTDPRERSLDVVTAPHGLLARIRSLLFGAGVLVFEDLESGQRAEVDVGARRTTAAFAAAVATAADERRVRFSRLKLDTIEIEADAESEADYVKPLAAFFRRRSRRH